MANEGKIIKGKKIAVKYIPPIIAFEYIYENVKQDEKGNYLLEVLLEEFLDKGEKAEKIYEHIENKYFDVVNKNTFSKEQIIRMVQRIENNYNILKGKDD